MLVVLLDDVGFGAVERVRRAVPDADRRAAGRGRAALQPVPHHGAVRADAAGAAHRPQPPLGRAWAASPRPRPRRPGNSSLRPEHQGAAGDDAEAERLLDRPVRQVPRGAGVADARRWARSTPGRPAAAGSRPSTASSAARTTSGTRRCTTARRRSSRRRRRRRATTSPRTWPTTPSSWMRQQKALMPDKPFFVYFAPGATHAPHHVPKEWADKYAGQFDDGWDAQRERTFARQKELGVDPGRRRADRAARRDPGLGRHARRAQAGAGAADGGLRRVPRAHRPPRRPADRRASRTSGSSTTRSSTTSSATTAPPPRAR